MSSTVTPVAPFALICYHNPDISGRSIEVTRWGTRAEAEQASAELAPCSPKCVGVHTIVAVTAQPAQRHQYMRSSGVAT